MVRQWSSFFFLLFLLVGASRPCSGDEVDNIVAEVDIAVADESYTRAISLLEEGKSRFPEDSRLPARAGRLYRDRELYRLAMAEFLHAESLSPRDMRLGFDIAGVHGYLGENAQAVERMEILLDRVNSEPESEDSEFRGDIIDDLSWLYFKTHRMDDGIAILEAALAEEFDRNWAHTLGTLYSGIYNAENSRLWYERSIEDALDKGDEYFASVAHYNLSLLEFSFYRYVEAREEALRSLDLRTRSGGYMVLGELDLLAWDLPGALDAFRRAESLDDTPLALVDLATFYRRTGHLDESLRFIGEAAGNGDNSWMYHYGLDSVRFNMDLSEIRARIWRGKAEVESLTPRWGLRERTAASLRRITWKLQSVYHNRRYRAFAQRHSRELKAEGNYLDAAWYGYMAHRGYRRLSISLLDEARNLELSFIDAAAPWYNLEEGLERKRVTLVSRAIDGFRPEEADPRERALRALSSFPGRSLSTGMAEESLSALYLMNPGGLRQYGLSLPVALNISGDSAARLRRRTTALLRRSGYTVVRSGKDSGNSPSVLTARTGDDGTVTWYFSGPAGQTRARGRSEGPVRRRQLVPVLAGLLDSFYLTPTAGASE